MMKTKWTRNIAWITASALGFVGIQAQAYQYEIGVLYGHADLPLSGLTGAESDTLGIGGDFYLTPVDVTNRPRGEAAFLAQATSFGVSYLSTDFEDDFTGLDEDESALVVGGRYVDVGSGLVLEADIFAADADGYRIAGGMYISDDSQVLLSWASDDESQVDELGVGFKSVTPYIGDSFLGLEADISRSSIDSDGVDADWTTISADGTYFVTPLASFGVGLGFGSGDIDSTEYRVFGELFLNDNVGVGASYEVVDYDEFDGEEKTWLLTAFLRQ
ncbi:MAG: putative porin [Pseudomonadota bacterium]